MKTLTKEDSIAWCLSNRVALDARFLPDLTDASLKFDIPSDAQKRVYLVNESMQSFREEPAILVWFKDWGVWPSGERMHIFERIRLSYGETRRPIEAPAQVFESAEFNDAISFVTIAVLFLWDCYVVSPGSERALFFSHDEYGIAKGVASIG